MISLKNESIEVLVPTKLSEITKERLNEMFGVINLPDNYCIVAVLQKVKLSQFAMMTVSKAKETLVYTIPIIGKLPNNFDYKGKIEVGQKVIVTRTNLEMGTALSMSTMISVNNLNTFLNENESIRQKCFRKEIADDAGNTDVWIYVFEGKIIPMSDIRGTIDLSVSASDPFSNDL